MRTPPLLADFSHARVCKPFCENFLTLPFFLSSADPVSPVGGSIKKEKSPDGHNFAHRGSVVYLYMPQNREQLEQGTRCEIIHFLRSFGSLMHFNFSVIFDFKSCDKNSISFISKATAFMGDLYPLIRILLGPII